MNHLVKDLTPVLEVNEKKFISGGKNSCIYLAETINGEKVAIKRLLNYKDKHTR